MLSMLFKRSSIPRRYITHDGDVCCDIKLLILPTIQGYSEGKYSKIIQSVQHLWPCFYPQYDHALMISKNKMSALLGFDMKCEVSPGALSTCSYEMGTPRTATPRQLNYISGGHVFRYRDLRSEYYADLSQLYFHTIRISKTFTTDQQRTL